MTISSGPFMVAPRSMHAFLAHQFGEEVADYLLDQQRRMRNVMNGTATMPMPDLSPRRRTRAASPSRQGPGPFDPFGYTTEYSKQIFRALFEWQSQPKRHDAASVWAFGAALGKIWPSPYVAVCALGYSVTEVPQQSIQSDKPGRTMARTSFPQGGAPLIRVAQEQDNSGKWHSIAHELGHMLCALESSPAEERLCSHFADAWLEARS